MERSNLLMPFPIFDRKRSFDPLRLLSFAIRASAPTVYPHSSFRSTLRVPVLDRGFHVCRPSGVLSANPSREFEAVGRGVVFRGVPYGLEYSALGQSVGSFVLCYDALAGN